MQVYGYQNVEDDASSECLLRRNALSQQPANAPVVLGSKYFTIPWTNFLIGGNFRFGLQPLSDALDGTLQRLGRDSVGLYMIHSPFPTYPIEVWAASHRIDLSYGLGALSCFASPAGSVGASGLL